MTTNNLRSIHAFPDLLRYLEEELGWPLQEYGFDDLTFEYSPAELGLKEEDAAAVKAIHQLRPIVTGQPWGIFFVEFEKKKLPVVVLRRILSHLVIKQRTPANKATAPAWHAEDLLFVTAFGEDGEESREIAFAHFHQAAGDMPTLHVLGWDGGDTPLKLAHVDRVLRERLHWPEDENDAEAWRTAWRSPFKHRIGHVIRTADQLAETLAKLARGIRDKARRMLDAESERGALRKLHKAFQTGLIHDLSEENFADTYAQTITYGLLTAAISRTDMSEGRHGTVLLADNVADIVPVTNPFLKEMLQTFLKVGGRKGGIDFDELGIQDVVELLRGDETDLPAILLDFGNKTRGEDPVIHFYEHFLSAYNKKLKVQRGVFYTPQPVVSYIVRSVHELLQTEFGLEDGLASTITWGEMVARQIPPSPPFAKGGVSISGASVPPFEKVGVATTGASVPPFAKGGLGGISALTIPQGTPPDTHFVQILDPATGTGTFLVEVIAVIHRTLTDKWKKQGMSEAQQLDAWNDYVPRHLLPRLHGYELMMAPYAIAHMKLGLKLHETGYRFGSEERVRVYLTNALEPAHEVQPQLEALAPALAHEAQAVVGVKRDARFTVVIGNPPYSNFGMMNKIPFILGLLEDYKRGLDEKKLNLDDDFIKFIRLAHWEIEITGCGVVGFITNNTFIDGITHRQMRAAIQATFPKIYVLDLHGSSSKKETCPDGTKDENVFDIQQGVGVSLFISNQTKHSQVSHADAWGVRGSKYTSLEKSSLRSTEWGMLTPEAPYHFFVPKDFRLIDEYSNYSSLVDVFSINGPGVKTERDGVSIHRTKDEIKDTVRAFRENTASELRARFELGEDSRDWKVENAKADVLANRSEKLFKRILYRPFDYRHTWYSGKTRGFIGTPGYPVMKNMLDSNAIGLLAMRQFEYDVPDYCYIFVTPTLTECRVFVSNRGIANIFPLYLLSDSDGGQQTLTSNQRRTNLQQTFLNILAVRLGLKREGFEGYPAGVTPEDIFHYTYAVFHSPGYRNRYAEFLKIDFPRIPLPDGLPLFQSLATLGGELVALHLLESPKVNTFITRFEGQGDNSIPKKPTYKDGAVWINPSQRFEGVPEAVWNFHIGGYQVCEKWLKDRKGRTLSADDIAHYQRIVVALFETIRLMAEIDRVIEAHGGWPGAFQAVAPAEKAS